MNSNPSAFSKMMFHPFEIGFSGFSNTGKTILVTQLIEKLKTKYQIGYVKHASCGFNLDIAGKDSDLVYKSGAAEIHLIDEVHRATISRGNNFASLNNIHFLIHDMIFIEGFKDAYHEKIVFLDPEKEILMRAKNVIATIGDGGDFQRNDLESISLFIENHFQRKIEKQPLFGLILAGGMSRRMGQDKALIHYGNTSQAKKCKELLSPYCDQIFLSRRASQETEGLPVIYDKFLEFGPIGGILTAMKNHPDAAWFVLACDFPFMDEETLKHLYENRNPFKFATCYTSDDSLPEPLCTIYEPKSYSLLLQSLSYRHKCLRNALIHSPIKILHPPSTSALKNINSPLPGPKTNSFSLSS